MRRTASIAICLGMIFFGASVRAEETRVVKKTPLRASPTGGESLGELDPQATVSTLERSGDWVRVRVEGWVPAGMLAAAPVPASVAAVPPVAAPAAIAAAGAGSLEGTLEVKKAGWLLKKKVTGVGRQVWLLPSGIDLEAAGQVTAEDAALLAQLDADAERLAKEASKAMQGSSFSDSTQKHDALMKGRDKVLAQRVNLLALHHGRREAAARGAALLTATCGARGLYVFPSVAPGAYRLYARLVDSAVDLEWIEAVELGAGGRKLDLDETNAQGLPR